MSGFQTPNYPQEEEKKRSCVTRSLATVANWATTGGDDEYSG
jgi:hypothetical protein